MSDKREEFVTVQLTLKGEEVARGERPPIPLHAAPEEREKLTYKGPASKPCLRICGGATRAEGEAVGGYEFCFQPGETQQVTLGEWNAILSQERRDGEALLEIIEKEER